MLLRRRENVSWFEIKFFQLNEKRRVLLLGFPWRQPYNTFSSQPATAYIIMVDVNITLYISCERLNTSNVSSKQYILYM